MDSEFTAILTDRNKIVPHMRNEVLNLISFLQDVRLFYYPVSFYFIAAKCFTRSNFALLGLTEIIILFFSYSKRLNIKQLQ